MAMKIIGREREIKRITNFATAEPENKAFFGVKGIGKSTLFESVFSKSKCKMYAEEYQYLFVRTILSPDTKGDDLVNFLIDRIINAIDLIGDSELKNLLHQKLKEDEDKYYSKDSFLRDALETIKEYDYCVILIMDEFHNMGRNKSVGSNQYDYLRSLNELGLIYYWIISDSDFSDVYATSQFTTSFFAQKFIPETIPQMSTEDMIELIKQKSEGRDLSISDDVIQIICSIIGGIPAFVVPSVMTLSTLGSDSFDEDLFISQLLENPACLSLLSSWCRSLTSEQKDLLREIALHKQVLQNDYLEKIGKINQLGDNSGLGLLIHSDNQSGRYWAINSKLFSSFIINKTDNFYAVDIVLPDDEKQKEKSQGTTFIQNNYFTVNNNFFNPTHAAEALFSLRDLIESQKNLLLPDSSVLTSAIQQLPYQQDEWDSITDEEKDDKMDAFADNVLSSNAFKSDSLSENQMQRFYLNQSILDNLTETSRNNLISAIQVYDLLQFCVDRFGLSLLNSESARGILFARLYESILKESFCPALVSVDEIASKALLVEGVSYSIKDAPVNKLTLGSFVFILQDRKVRRKLADICDTEIQKSMYDTHWWKNHQTDMYNISSLRNDCCHSGHLFDKNKLDRLLQCMFELGAISSVEIYNDITNRN